MHVVYENYCANLFKLLTTSFTHGVEFEIEVGLSKGRNLAHFLFTPKFVRVPDLQNNSSYRYRKIIVH